MHTLSFWKVADSRTPICMLRKLRFVKLQSAYDPTGPDLSVWCNLFRG